MSMSTIRMRDILALVVVAAILIAMIPTIVFAADNSEIDGVFTLGNSAPSITSVELCKTDNNTHEGTSMTPLSEYVVKVTISDINGLNDLGTCNVTIFDDIESDNLTITVPTSDNATHAATLHLAVGAIPVWSITDNTTTWAIVESGCYQPTLADNVTSGEFGFRFKVGKTATEADDWDIYAKVADKGGLTGDRYDATGYHMNWYGEINTTAPASWSGVTAGMAFTDGPADVEGISVNYIANGNYKVAVTTDGSWNSTTNSATLNTTGSPIANEFSLKANNVAVVPGNGNLVTMSVADCVIDNAGVQTISDVSGLTVATNALYLMLGSPFVNGAYSGHVCYTIINR